MNIFFFIYVYHEWCVRSRVHVSGLDWIQDLKIKCLWDLSHALRHFQHHAISVSCTLHFFFNHAAATEVSHPDLCWLNIWHNIYKKKVWTTIINLFSYSPPLAFLTSKRINRFYLFLVLHLEWIHFKLFDINMHMWFIAS